MTIDDEPDPAFDRTTARLIQREALRRAASEISTTTPAGLESVLARISAEVTDAATAARSPDPGIHAASSAAAKAAPRVPEPPAGVTEPPPPHPPRP